MAPPRDRPAPHGPSHAAARPAEHGSPGRAQAFERLVTEHAGSLSRLAYLLLGDRDAADDLAADALLAAWRQWDTVCDVEQPTAYLRRVVVNMAASRVRSAARERRRMRLFQRDATAAVQHDPAAVVDVQDALRRLPARRRACVVLRYAFDLPEDEVARTLGVAVGTVKSQTSKGAAQLRTLLGDGSGVSSLECPGTRADEPGGRGRGAAQPPTT
ncbi:SigE family RNA polymerase sigma factor [Thalassiella azotivora]